MRIDQEKCKGCGLCIPFCPVGAIQQNGTTVVIDEEACLECGTCGRSFVVKCPTGALIESENLYARPRSIRKFFSDPMAYHVETKVPGRGTEEVKTNDVTGRVKKNEVGIAIEVGRPCLGTNFKDVEKVTMALAEMGIQYEKNNPLTYLMEDVQTGTFCDDALRSKVVSAIIEFTLPGARLQRALEIINEVSKEIDTVFSLDLIVRLDPDGNIPVEETLRRVGMDYLPNAKINLGLGRPLAEV